jgi:hypothetical protein
MTSSVTSWLPDGSLFLERADLPPVRPERPWNQGDVFADVPITITDRTGAGAVKLKTIQGHAALIGHTCSLRGGGKTAVFQNVAHVRPAKPNEITRFEQMTPKWDCYFQLFPYVDLYSDQLWVADFNVVGTVHFKYLVDHRVACLNLQGWAAFQRRYGNHALRIDQSIEFRVGDLRGLWTQLDLWEEWCRRGFSEPEFDAWLNQPIEAECHYKGTRRRDAVELAADIILEEMPAAGSSTVVDQQSDTTSR